MIIGLTGGIGSGKTTVAQIFKVLGIPIFVADEVSKEIIDTDQNLQGKLVDLIGPDLVKGGKIDRPYMAKRIFNDSELLRAVNALIHPAVGRAFKSWREEKQAAYVIREAAILFESGTHHDCDKIVVVTAPEDLRIKRLKKRSGENVEQIKARMDKQWPQEKKAALADYLIFNDGSQLLIPQVVKVHEDLIRSANAQS